MVGLAQALALFPGVSRSGITIVAGLWRKMTREAAARFSFLLSTPLIAGAALKEVPKLITMHRAGGLELPLSTLLIAIGVSAVVGYARHWLSLALSADTHPEDLYCLPHSVWYSHSALGVPPQGNRAIQRPRVL